MVNVGRAWPLCRDMVAARGVHLSLKKRKKVLSLEAYLHCDVIRVVSFSLWGRKITLTPCTSHCMLRKRSSYKLSGGADRKWSSVYGAEHLWWEDESCDHLNPIYVSHLLKSQWKVLWLHLLSSASSRNFATSRVTERELLFLLCSQ